MIHMVLQDRDHECAAGERPCLCKLQRLVTRAGDIAGLNVLRASPSYVALFADPGEEHRAVERAARALRQRQGQFALVHERMREDVGFPPEWRDIPF